MVRSAAAAALSVLVATTAVSAAKADDVLDQLDGARDLYQKGEFAKAVSELQFVITDIRRKVAAKYIAALPPAPAGWKAGEAESRSGAMIGGGQAITRNYQADDGNGSIDLQLMVDNPMTQAMLGLMSNPAMLAADPSARRVRINGENAILKWDASEKSGELSLVLGNRMLIHAEGQNLQSEAVLSDLVKACDFKAIKAAGGLD
ncbi:MAG TPA: hypothetical protein VFL74_00735 [Sphingomicrobium sp.]|nr:hypothetical protein [Sphingomicrobium sp.]